MFKGPREGECFALCRKAQKPVWLEQAGQGRRRKRERQAGARLWREDYECYSKCARTSLSSLRRVKESSWALTEGHTTGEWQKRDTFGGICYSRKHAAKASVGALTVNMRSDQTLDIL